jgi:hypothetical protein
MELKFGLETEINLDNPIFVYYVNIQGLSRQSADEMLYKLSDTFTYKNVTIWIIPRKEGETKIECVYDGRVKERSEELAFLIDEINEKVDILSKSGSFDDFKINVRDWRIKNIIK